MTRCSIRLGLFVGSLLCAAICGCGSDETSDTTIPEPTEDAQVDANSSDAASDTRNDTLDTPDQHADSAADATEASIDASTPDDAPLDSEQETSVDAPADQTGPGCTAAPRTFWVYDLSVMPPTYQQVPSTCRAEGPSSYIYVADDIWNTSVDQGQIDSALAAFETTSPADPTRGIYPLTTSTFGAPPDVDSDGHVILLYTKLEGYQGNLFDGFIRREDVLGGSHSNQSEILYLDGVRNPPSSEYMLGVVAHEFTHIIFLAHDTNEAGWMEETMAEASMVRCGYLGDLDGWVAQDFALNPTQSLTTQPPNFNYGAGLLFGGYLLERMGESFLTALVAEPTDGVPGLAATLSSQGKPDTVRSLVGDWTAANFLDAPTIGDGRWGYQAFDVPDMAATEVAAPSVLSTHNVAAYSARYFVFDITAAANSTAQISLQSNSFANLEIRHAVYPNTDKTSATVGSWAMGAASDTVHVDGVGGTMNRLLVVVTEATGSAAQVSISSAIIP